MKHRSIIAVFLAVLLAAGLCACSGGGGETVYAQSVRSLNDAGPAGLYDRYAGVAVSGRTKEIKKDPSLTVEEVLVEEGQLVKAGDVLFTYNNESARLNVEQAQLEIESMKNKIDVSNAQIAELTKERNAAASADKLGYTLEIQGLEADVKETQYNIGVKEKELKTLQEAAADTQVKSDLAGRVTAINTSGETGDDGSEKPFITIVETGNLRIKGLINELNRGALNEGDVVTVRSRTDDAQTWRGIVRSIDWANAEQGGQNGYDGMYGGMSGGDEMTSSSKYPFYVEVEDPEDLFIGQHVYIEPGEAVAARTDALTLPSWFLCDIEGDPWVWAVNARDKLEKRSVTLGDYDAETDCYAIADGLTEEDYVAYPDDTLQPGMKAEKTDGPVPMGQDDGMMTDDGYMDDGGYMEDGGYMDDGFDAMPDDGLMDGGMENDEALAGNAGFPEEGATRF